MVIPAYFLFIIFAFMFHSLENHDRELFFGDLGKIQVVIDVIRSFVSGQTIKLNLKREITYGISFQCQKLVFVSRFVDWCDLR